MNITVAGAGYVGLSLATLLSIDNDVTLLDVVKSKVDMINNRKSPIDDTYIEKYFKEQNLNLVATLDKESAYGSADIVIVATPTNYDELKDYFDTGLVEDAVSCALKYGDNSTIVIKSTIPVGYTDQLRTKYNTDRIIFSPEFLREGNALHDNLFPSRIVVGDKGERGRSFAELLKNASIEKNCSVVLMNNTEAEAVKLFSNSYLAMRVAYFNELDDYALKLGLDSKSIIDGMCYDSRIGQGYNNPSFGYGGYCLPKDTKQLLANYVRAGVDNSLINSIIESNQLRKSTIIRDIECKPNVGTIGVYRLTMKAGSDNFRSSAIKDILLNLHNDGYKVKIYEPTIDYCGEFEHIELDNDFKHFANSCDLIIANRLTEELLEIKDKVYTRDVYGNN